MISKPPGGSCARIRTCSLAVSWASCPRAFRTLRTGRKLRNSWRCWHVNCEDVPRARGHIRDVINTYGKDSNRYRVRVAGLFPTHDDDTVIPLELVEAAVNRKVTPLAYWPIWGVDV